MLITTTPPYSHPRTYSSGIILELIDKRARRRVPIASSIHISLNIRYTPTGRRIPKLNDFRQRHGLGGRRDRDTRRMGR